MSPPPVLTAAANDSPPFDSNFTAKPFILATFTNYFQQINSYRPVTTFTWNTPQTVTYFWGLVIVPLILIAAFLLWFLIINIIALCQCYARSNNKNTSCCQNPFKNRSTILQRSWICLHIFLFISFCGWICAFAFAIQLSISDYEYVKAVDKLSFQFYNVSKRLQLLQNQSISLATIVAELPPSCQDYLPAAKLQQVETKTYDFSSNILTETTRVLPQINQVSSSMNQASSTMYNYLVIRTAITATLSGICMLVVLSFMITFYHIKTRKNFSLAGNCLSSEWCYGRCCCTWNLCLTTFFLLIIIILAGLIHAITLFITDACSPNINVSLDILAGQFANYPPSYTFDNSRTSQGAVCEYYNSQQSTYGFPLEIQGLCYYQTCNESTTPFSSNLFTKLEHFVVDTEQLDADGSFLRATVNGTIPPSVNLNICGQQVKSYFITLTQIYVSILWILFGLSCPQINQFYSSLLYGTTCTEQVYYGASLFSSWVVGVVFLMCAYLHWMFIRQDYMKDKGEKTPLAADLLENAEVVDKQQSIMSEKQNSNTIGDNGDQSFQLQVFFFVGRKLSTLHGYHAGENYVNFDITISSQIHVHSRVSPITFTGPTTFVKSATTDASVTGVQLATSDDNAYNIGLRSFIFSLSFSGTPRNKPQFLVWVDYIHSEIYLKCTVVFDVFGQFAMSRIQGIHHVQISVPVGGKEKAREFYCSFLGLKEIVRETETNNNRKGFWAVLPNQVQIHFTEEDGVDRFATRSHIGYQVEQVEYWKQKLVNNNIQIIEGTSLPGLDRFEFRDPFGNRIEFLSRKTCHL